MSATLGVGKIKLIEKIIKENFNIEAKNKTFNYNELLYVINELLDEEGAPYLVEKLSKRGYSVFREFVKYLLYRNLANYDTMLVVSSLKGCLDGEKTKLRIPNCKKLKTLEELYNDNKLHISDFYVFDIKNKIKTTAKGKIFKTGTKEVFEILIDKNKKVYGTKNHKFFIKNKLTKKIEEKRLKDIKVGDLILCT